MYLLKKIKDFLANKRHSSKKAQHPTLSPAKQSSSVTQVRSMTVVSPVLKGRLIALEVVKSRTEALRSIRGWHF